MPIKVEQVEDDYRQLWISFYEILTKKVGGYCSTLYICISLTIKIKHNGNNQSRCLLREQFTQRVFHTEQIFQLQW